MSNTNDRAARYVHTIQQRCDEILTAIDSGRLTTMQVVRLLSAMEAASVPLLELADPPCRSHCAGLAPPAR